MDTEDVFKIIWVVLVIIVLGICLLLHYSTIKKYSFSSEQVEATVIDKNVTSDVYYINTMPYKRYEMDITLQYEGYQLKVDDNDNICKKHKIGDTITAYIVTRMDRKTGEIYKYLSLKSCNYD